MFPYSDPVGADFLGNPTVRDNYRRLVDAQYDRTASRAASAITWLEAFDEVPGNQIDKATISWLAFPITANASESEIDADRFLFQDEYIEWRVEQDTNNISKITFCTDFPEYYEAFAEAGHAELLAAISEAIPGAAPTPGELYGQNSVPASAKARSQSFRTNLESNPWNNGEKGILCLTQRFNTLSALFGLLVECGINRGSEPVGNTCGLVGSACGDGRASDPVVCSAAQNTVRADKCFSPVDPAGIRISAIEGGWELNGQSIDLSNPANGLWEISRGGRRGTLSVPTGLTLNGAVISNGAQVARVVRVLVEVHATRQANLPVWARTGRENLGRGGGA